MQKCKIALKNRKFLKRNFRNQYNVSNDFPSPNDKDSKVLKCKKCKKEPAKLADSGVSNYQTIGKLARNSQNKF